MLFSKIRLQHNRFTATQNKIVQYLQAHAQEALTLPINEFAAKCGVGEATVIRFYRLLGYKNYAMFRVALAKELAAETDTQPIYEEVQAHDGLTDIIRKVADSTTQGISDLKQQLSAEALATIEQQLRQAAVVHVIGLGASGVVAQDARQKFMRLGCRVIGYSDSHLMMIAASIARPDEVFFAISHSGETTDILRTLALAQKRGCFTCALTSSIDSGITQLVDAYLLSCTCETKMRSDAMISRIVQLVVIDILYVMMALQIGEPAIAGVNQSRAALRQYRNQSD